ncbi:HAD family hydrolase [Yoonia sp.]|uniref:HAD hydrolase-like protein n=1 Tax=Yoonia sp. TaxID=2212373 RepID=UPI00345B9597
MPEVSFEMRVFDRLSADIVTGARLVLSDLDGCLVSQGRAYADALDFAAACDDRLWIVSNNSTHSAQSLSDELAALGLTISAQRILLAGEQTLRHLQKTYPGVGLALFAGDCLQAQARAFGLRTDSEVPEVALLCRDSGFTIVDLERLASFLRQGARLWVSNIDCAHPSMDGLPVPETGALLAALNAVLGDVAFDTIGKPHTHMARLALDSARIAPHDAIFIGDNLATDGTIARNAGIPFAHIVRGPAR